MGIVEVMAKMRVTDVSGGNKNQREDDDGRG